MKIKAATILTHLVLGSLNMTIAQGEHYTAGADSQRQPGVPQGAVTKYAWESKIYPNTRRDYYVYVPAQYDPAKPAALMVFQDGHAYVKEDGDFRAPIVFDNLIHRGEMPVTIGLFVNPGYWGDVPPDNPFRGQNRSSEYDEVTDLYASFIINELVVELKKSYKISDDPKMHAICGLSSGGICAFTAAWFRPDYFHKVLSHIGSFTDIRGGHIYPALIRKSSKRDIKVFLQDGSNDLDNQFGNWWLANQQMASSLNYKGYDFKFVAGTGGHDGKHGGAILPESLRWLWNDGLQEVASGKYGWSDLPAHKTPQGEERPIFKGKTRDLSRFTMQAITVAPGKSIAALVSQESEAVLIVKSGELQVTVGKESKPLGTGSVALILPGAEHAVKNASSFNATFYLLDYQPRLPMDAARGEAAGGSLLVDWKFLPFKAHDKGGRRDFFDRPTAACSRYEMHATTLKPNTESHPPHTHRTAEMFVILEGNVELQIGDGTFRGGNGDVFYVESEVPHAIKNVGEGQAVYFAFQWR
jgi:quercetin dioxygenase-like cupin family protein/enterochelin esterase-like enzyme